MNLFFRSLTVCTPLWAAQPGSAIEYTITTLPGSGGGQTVQAFGINNAGQVAISIVGGSVGFSQRAFIWQAGSFTPLSGPAGALGASALGIANNGMVVGSYYTALVDDGSGNLIPDIVRGYVLKGGSYSTVEVTGHPANQMRQLCDRYRPGGLHTRRGSRCVCG